MGNDPVNGVDKDGGFFQELINLFLHGMFISNEGYSAYQALEAQDLAPSYHWEGSRIKGHGVLTWQTSMQDESDPNNCTPVPIGHSEKFEPIRDVIRNVNGQMYAMYPDLELKITGGLRAAEVMPMHIEGIDINIFSVDLVKYSFAENKKSYIWDPRDWKDLSFNSGVEGDLDGLEIGAGFSIGGGKMESSISMSAGILTIERTKNLMEKEASAVLGVGFGGDGKFGVGIVAEAKLMYKQEKIPGNDVDAWYKKE